jgi:peptidyl-prolyl cis-trans isomerase D
MLTNIREGLGKLFAILVLALIAVTFVFWGVDFGLTTGTVAARVNGEDVSLYEFDQALRTREQQLALSASGQITNETRNQLRSEVINMLVADQVALQRARDLGFVVTEELVATAIASQPQFQVGDNFSFDIYQSRLISEGITADYYEAIQENALYLNSLRNLFTDTSFVLPYEFRLIVGLLTEQRRFSYALFPTDIYYDESSIPDESLAIYFDANRQNYLTDASLDISLIEINSDMFDETANISEEELLEYYEINSDRFINEEQRLARHILLPLRSNELGEDLVGRISQGELFEDLASEYSQDTLSAQQGGDLGFISRGLFPAEFEEVLFSLEVGSISNLVETQFGLHIIRLDEINQGLVQEYDEVRDILLVELQNELEGTQFYDTAIQLADLLYSNNLDLLSLADSINLPINEITNLTLESDQVDIRIIETAFLPELRNGSISPIIELGENHLAVLQVANYYEPVPLEFEVVTSEIRSGLAQAEAVRLAQIQAQSFLDALQEALDGGADIPQLAQEMGATWSEPRWVARDGELNDTPLELAEASFVLEKPNEGSFVVNITQLNNGQPVVMILNDVEYGSTEELDDTVRQSYGFQLTELISAIEYETYLQQAFEDASINISDMALAPVY